MVGTSEPRDADEETIKDEIPEDQLSDLLGDVPEVVD